MADIADLRDGNFYFIEELKTKPFVDCLGGLLSSIAQNVTLRIKPEEGAGVKITQASCHPNMWRFEDGIYQTKLVQLMAEKTKDFALELTLGKLEADVVQQQFGEIKVPSAEAEFYDFNGKKIAKKADFSPFVSGTK